MLPETRPEGNSPADRGRPPYHWAMRVGGRPGLFLALLFSALGAALSGESSAGSQTSQPVPALFLHYRWHADGSLTLVSRKTLPARLKPSRSAAHRKSAGDAFRAPTPLPGGATALSYALLDAKGDTLSETKLPDPRIRRVEVQEKGEPQLRTHAVRRDSGDFFLRIAEPEAASIRFFKWHPLGPAAGGAPLRKAGAAKSVIGEFDLR